MQNLGRLRHNLGTFYLSIRPCSTKNITAVSEDDYIGEDVRAIKTDLNYYHRIIAEGGIPPITYETEKNKWAMQERFGRYGLKSEVDVRKLWPTIEEIEELNALRLYRKATDAIEIAAKAQKMEKEKKLKKLADIEKNFANYPAKLQAYEESSKKVDEQAVSKEKKNESRVLEVQAYFGYWIDPKDPRFETMMKQKEAEEKKKNKLVKRQEVTAKKKLSAEQSLTEKPKES